MIYNGILLARISAAATLISMISLMVAIGIGNGDMILFSGIMGTGFSIASIVGLFFDFKEQQESFEDFEKDAEAQYQFDLELKNAYSKGKIPFVVQVLFTDPVQGVTHPAMAIVPASNDTEANAIGIETLKAKDPEFFKDKVIIYSATMSLGRHQPDSIDIGDLFYVYEQGIANGNAKLEKDEHFKQILSTIKIERHITY
jgi:hypothetical protein